MIANKQPTRRAFLLLEALLAMMVFGIAITAAIKVLHSMSELNHDIIHRSAMAQRAQNIMLQVMHEATPDGEFVRDQTIELDEQTEARLLVTALETTNDDENLLNEMFLVELTISSKEDPERNRQEFSMVHYRYAIGGPRP
ncbi:hypothetical protein [Rubritalea marina]|uniref:hypothetical protein n=1 Tax=Rubritalea marina TaxID=361055 RepID=UPI00036931FA|nr:hypothetical protein [Rubritalea marina]